MKWNFWPFHLVLIYYPIIWANDTSNIDPGPGPLVYQIVGTLND